MKLLWIINIPLPPLCKQMGWKEPVLGGWLYSSFKQLMNQKEFQLFVACPYSSGNEFIDREIDGVRYFCLPYKRRNLFKKYTYVREFWKSINSEIKPDIVHIHGTEFALGNDFVDACGGTNVVVSIQGLVSVIAPYYLGDIFMSDILKNLTLRDIVRNSSLLKEKTDFFRRGKIEIDTIKRVGHVIGRTEWDKSHVWAINPVAKYHKCGEILRDSFYNNKWEYASCEPHSIFISQAGYPLKGLHKVLKALSLVLKHYPDTKVYIAGHDITKKNPWYRFSGYGKYIGNLIKTLRLSSHVQFVGPLSEIEMCHKFLCSNLYICSSIIENSPNSLGEAQALGVPVLASYVGGIPDMMQENQTNLYRFDDVELLAYKICEIFSKGNNAEPSGNIRSKALLRHSQKENILSLLSIYKNIVN